MEFNDNDTPSPDFQTHTDNNTKKESNQSSRVNFENETPSSKDDKTNEAQTVLLIDNNKPVYKSFKIERMKTSLQLNDDKISKYHNSDEEPFNSVITQQSEEEQLSLSENELKQDDKLPTNQRPKTALVKKQEKLKKFDSINKLAERIVEQVINQSLNKIKTETKSDNNSIQSPIIDFIDEPYE
jgi:hypothetical protein